MGSQPNSQQVEQMLSRLWHYFCSSRVRHHWLFLTFFIHPVDPGRLLGPDLFLIVTQIPSQFKAPRSNSDRACLYIVESVVRQWSAGRQEVMAGGHG